MATAEKTQTLSETEEATAIRDEVQAFLSAWGSGDAKTATSFFADDAVRVDPAGEQAEGHEAIEAALDRMTHRLLPGAWVRSEPGDVRFLTPELAVWRGSFKITRPRVTEKIHGYLMLIYRKEADRWLIIEAHSKFYP